MNKSIMTNVGFEQEMTLVSEQKCPFCKKRVNIDFFRDMLSRKKFEISGLCQECQTRPLVNNKWGFVPFFYIKNIRYKNYVGILLIIN